MFQTEIEDGGSFLAFFFQQVGVCVAFVLWGAISGEFLAYFNGRGVAGNLTEALGNIAVGLGPGFLVGRMLRSAFPKLAYSGQWVWLLPSTVLAVMFISSTSSARLGQDFSDLLFPRQEGEAMWAIVLASYPTLGCIGYSLGIRLQSRRSTAQTNE